MDRQKTDALNLSRRNSRYFVFLAYRTRQVLGDFIFSDLMAEICRATIGDTAYLFWEQFVAKGTDSTGAEFPWHQDSGYVDRPHKPYVNCWVPLDDVSERNGTVYILPFSKAGTKERVEHKPVSGSNDRVGYFGKETGVPAANCVGGGLTGTVFHRLNRRDQFRQVQAADIFPDRSCLMLDREQLFQRALAKLHLVPHGVPHPLPPNPRRNRLIGLLVRPQLKPSPLVHHSPSGGHSDYLIFNPGRPQKFSCLVERFTGSTGCNTPAAPRWGAR